VEGCNDKMVDSKSGPTVPFVSYGYELKVKQAWKHHPGSNHELCHRTDDVTTSTPCNQPIPASD
jgi:hypothetical protein